LSGDTDNGTAINGFIQSGLLDFGAPNKKRCTDAYVGVDGGNLILSVDAEDTGPIAYSLRNTTQMKTVKAPLALGAGGRYWKYRLANVAGSKAVVDELEVIVVNRQRRV